MLLYFSPLACSMATRIAFYEAGVDADYVQVDTRKKRTLAGDDFFAINAMGQVPVLRTDDGEILTENSAILQAVAERLPEADLAPAGGPERARLHQWLCFIGTELHKAVFVPLLDPTAPDEVKRYARGKVGLRLGVLQTRLSGREFLLDRFSVADAYLATVLNWSTVCGIDLAQWPAVRDYQKRLTQRPSVAKAISEEYALYQKEQAVHAKQ
jgi:glutathione S-transferase